MVPKLNYQKNIDVLISNGLIPKNSIHDFRDLPREEIFQRLFDFYQGNIFQHYNHGIEPGLIFFNPKLSINAAANKVKDHYLITLNKGTVFKLLSTFNDNPDILKIKGLEKYQKVDKKSDYPLNELMFQLCCHFTFYHELGHLIQKSQLLETGLSEDITSESNFDQNRHVLEYDADLFSSLCLGTHLYQYIVNWCPSANQKEAESIISLTAASVFVYLLMFESTKLPFYLKENSHPHPIVRILSIPYYTADYIEKLSKKKENLKFNKERIISNLLKSSRILIGQYFEESVVQHIDEIMNNNIDEALKYNKKLFKLTKASKRSAFNKRNKVAK